jgi:hypothetical protein
VVASASGPVRLCGSEIELKRLSTEDLEAVGKSVQPGAIDA